MYEGLYRRTNRKSVAGRDVRLEPRSVFAHRGDAGDFIRRHRELCNGLPNMTRTQRQDVANQLLRVAADYRSAKLAWEQTASDPRAPGPDGIGQDDLPAHTQKQLFTMIGGLLEPGRYQAGNPRRVDIPKANKKTRPIDVSNLADSLASRMLAQAITPFLDPGLSPWCVGGRGYYSREMALIWATTTAEREKRWIWIAQDVQNAFPSVTRARLQQVLLNRLLTAATVEQVEKLIGEGKRGIPQGNPLSPLLLNVYLEHSLDRPWRKGHRDMPIIRYVDDLLVMLQETVDPDTCHRELSLQVQSAGMRLKHPMDSAIRDISCGEAVEWIGYRVSRTNGRWHVGVGESAWESLGLKLRECHRAINAPEAAGEVLRGWVGQQGACYHPDTVHSDVSRVARMAHDLHFREMARPDVLLGLWEGAHARFVARANVYRSCIPGYGVCEGSSADRCITAIRGRRGEAGQPPASPPLFSNSVQYRIWTDGSALQRVNGQYMGGWAYLIMNQHTRIVGQGSGCIARTTNNRMELLAVIRALESLDSETTAEVLTDSQYVIDCATNCRSWRQNHWHKKSKGLVCNHDLICEMLELCEKRHITFTKVKAHAGLHYNEIVDQEAHNQALWGTPHI